MDQWLQITKHIKSEPIDEDRKFVKRSSARYKPYGQNKHNIMKREKDEGQEFKLMKHEEDEHKELKETIHETSTHRPAKMSSSMIAKHLIKTLKDESNPLTHSDIYKRSDVVVSMTSGHQVADGSGSRSRYFEDRNNKLKTQKAEQGRNSQVLSGTRIYINGYLEDTTDIEMKRILTQAGAQVLNYPSRVTHILTSQQLNASKTQKIMSAKSRIHVVKPEWVYDSVEAGRRLPETKYSIIASASSRSLLESLSRGAG